MFEKNDIRRIHWLMQQYLSKKIDAKTFCDEFYYSYDLEIDYDTLTEEEYKALSALSIVADRFTDIADDHRVLPGFYYSEEELRAKIIETCKTLSIPIPVIDK